VTGQNKRWTQKMIVYGTTSRTLTARQVTYTCVRCGQSETTERYPGPTPRYCIACKVLQEAENAQADRKQARERMRRLREQRHRERVEQEAHWLAPF